jgi:SAM-dependent methyltransferase
MARTDVDDPAPYELPDAAVSAAWERLFRDCAAFDEGLEPGIARRLRAEGVRTFAEVGSASGPISAELAADEIETVRVDLNPPPSAIRPIVRGEMRSLPLRRASLDAVSLINCLYFLGDPVEGIRAAKDVLHPGGLLVAGAPSRYHDPELRDVLPDWGAPSPFDAEEAAALVGAVFEDIEVEWWESPAWALRTQDAVVDYLVAFRVPDAEALAERVTTPVTITKSGVNVWARC